VAWRHKALYHVWRQTALAATKKTDVINGGAMASSVIDAIVLLSSLAKSGVRCQQAPWWPRRVSRCAHRRAARANTAALQSFMFFWRRTRPLFTRHAPVCGNGKAIGVTYRQQHHRGVDQQSA